MTRNFLAVDSHAGNLSGSKKGEKTRPPCDTEEIVMTEVNTEIPHSPMWLDPLPEFLHYADTFNTNFSLLRRHLSFI